MFVLVRKPLLRPSEPVARELLAQCSIVSLLWLMVSNLPPLALTEGKLGQAEPELVGWAKER